MPIYEYICKDCGFHFDAIRSFKESDSPIQCKSCQSDQTRRMISLFFSQSDSRATTHSSGGGGCGGCSGGSCAGCHH